MDPLKTPSSASNDEDKSKDNSPEEPQGVPPVDEAEDAPVEVAKADTDKPAADDSATDSDAPSVATATTTPDASTSDESKPEVSADTDAKDDAPVTDDAKSADPVAAPAPAMSGTPVVPGMPSAATPAGAPAGKSRKKMMLLSALVAVLVLLLGGAAAAYYMVLNKPENVLKMALANSLSKEKVKSMHFSGSFDVTEDTSGQSLGATFTGAADNTTGAFDLSGKLDVLVTNITFDVRSVDGKSAYLRLGGLEGLPELLASSGSAEVAQLYAPMIAAVNNQWFEVNESLLKQFTGTKESTLSDADVEKLKDIYQKHSFLVVKEKLASEKIKGVDSHHYKIVIDKAKLKSFVAALKDAKLNSLELTKEQVDLFNKSLEDVDFNKYPFEVWISKSDKLINQVAFTFKEGGATGKFRLTADSFNKEVKVEKPEGAKSILEVLGTFYGGVSGSSSGSMEFDSSSLEELQGLDSGISL